MLNNSYVSVLIDKEKIVLDCIDVLTQANTIDFCFDEAKRALREAYQILVTYPSLEGYKRFIAKEDTPDYYVFRAFYLLKGMLLIGETIPDSLELIIDCLILASEDLQIEIDILAD